MALRGNLRDFSLPDVFQLITFSRKTGVLRIRRSDDAEGSVWFRDGDVFFAQSNWHREPLGQRLVKAGKVTPQALERALEARAAEVEGGRRLGEILVSEGYITEKVLETFVQEQIQDTIFDLMRWDEGQFDFEVLPEAVDEDIGLSVSIENVIMEGSRRLEEWNRIKKKVPSMDVVYKMATAPGEGTFEISLKPVEWNLLLLVDGTRSVSELASETGRTDFDVARIVYGLFSAGLLEMASEEEVARLRAERAEREQRNEAILRERRAVSEARQREEAERRAAEQAEREKAEAEAKESADREAREEERRATLGRSEALPEEPSVAEEPEFLAGASEEPSAADVAVFEEMMGVLSTAPVEEAESARAVETRPVPEPEPEPEPAPEPEPEPEPEPAPEPAPEPEPMPVVETEPPGEGWPVVSVPMSESEASGEGAEEQVVPIQQEAPAWVPPLVPVEEAPDESGQADEQEDATALEGSYERDLMALGLGEGPGQDLLQPLATPPETSVQEQQETPEQTRGPAGLEQALPEEMTIAELEAMAVAREVGPAQPGPGAGEEPVAEERAAESPVEEPYMAEPREVEPPLVVPSEGEERTTGEEPDLSALLTSLEEPAAEASGESGQVTGTEGETVETGVGEGGVISTDAYLADIDREDIGLGGGLSDELTALTGGGSVRQRPVTSVNRIPEKDEDRVLHRDQFVDKELVMRIIEGIKDL